ncbi:putative membrane protein, partial [Vibrio parahaemolyticus IDH02640]
MAIFILITFC